MDLERESAEFLEAAARLRTEMGKVIVGYETTITHLLVCLLARGHALLEGVPGIGKTLFVRTLADALRLEFRRIQFTPDLMPADITGTDLLEDGPEGRRFRFREGPLFGNLVLADEINRATPKTQAALLEAMQERSVTMGGICHELPDPFLVFATQNPIEMEGTYPLPEAQLDRFLFKLTIPSPSTDELKLILRRTTGLAPETPSAVLGPDEVRRYRELVRNVHVPEPVLDYVVRILAATQPESEESRPFERVRRYVRFGASPRGGQALILGAKVIALLSGRLNAAFEDVRTVAAPALSHRILLDFEAEADEIPAESILDEVLDGVPESSERVNMLARAVRPSEE